MDLKKKSMVVYLPGRPAQSPDTGSGAVGVGAGEGGGGAEQQRAGRADPPQLRDDEALPPAALTPHGFLCHCACAGRF